MSPKKHEMTVIHCNYTGLSLVRQVNYTVLHIPGKFMYVLCNLEFSWRPRSSLNTSTITAGAQYSENTHTQNRDTLLYGHKHAVAYTRMLCLSHSGTCGATWGAAVCEWSGGQNAGLSTGWKKKPVMNNNQAIRDAHPAGWISGVGLYCHVQL